MSHTPGPWKVSGPYINVRADRQWPEPDVEICEVAEADPEPMRNGVTDANANLIAAAPDLLAACKAALTQQQRYMNGEGGGSDAGLIAALGAAIAKAEAKE